MERAKQILRALKDFLGDSNRRKYVLLLAGFLFSLIWFAVDFDDMATTPQALWKLRAGAFTTCMIGSFCFALNSGLFFTPMRPIYCGICVKTTNSSAIAFYWMTEALPIAVTALLPVRSLLSSAFLLRCSSLSLLTLSFHIV